MEEEKSLSLMAEGIPCIPGKKVLTWGELGGPFHTSHAGEGPQLSGRAHGWQAAGNKAAEREPPVSKAPVTGHQPLDQLYGSGHQPLTFPVKGMQKTPWACEPTGSHHHILDGGICDFAVPAVHFSIRQLPGFI